MKRKKGVGRSSTGAFNSRFGGWTIRLQKCRVAEQQLDGGIANAGQVVRVGPHVLRPSSPHSASIHAFLLAVVGGHAVCTWTGHAGCSWFGARSTMGAP
jgi:hypothetical protein